MAGDLLAWLGEGRAVSWLQSLNGDAHGGLRERLKSGLWLSPTPSCVVRLLTLSTYAHVTKIPALVVNPEIVTVVHHFIVVGVKPF